MVDTIDGLRFGQMAAGLAGPAGDLVSVGLSVPIAQMEAGKARREIAQNLSVDNLDKYVSGNSALKRALKEIEDRSISSVRNSAVTAGGSLIGMLALGATGAKVGAAVGTAVPIPFIGTIAGAAVGMVGALTGGFIANKIDDAVFSTQSNDAFAIAGMIQGKQQAGEKISNVEMFALLASSLPDQQLDFLNKRLEKLSGGKVKTITEAIKGGHKKHLEVLMQEEQTEQDLAAITGLHRQQGTTVSDQFAQMVNNGMSVYTLMHTELRGDIAHQMNLAGLGMDLSQGADVPGAPLPFPDGAQPTGTGKKARGKAA